MEHVRYRNKAAQELEGSVKQKEKKQYQHLCLEERKTIARMIGKGHTLSAIARHLSRGKQAIANEVKRNGGREVYNADKAHKLAMERKLERDIKCSVAIKTKFKQPQTDIKMAERIENLEMQMEILTEFIKSQKRGNE